MKIYRAARTGIEWNETDSREPRKYIKEWYPGKTIEFGGTVHGAERFTQIGVAIEEADVVAMLNCLVKGYRRTQSQLVRDLEVSRTETANLRRVLSKIETLIGFHSGDAPSPGALLEAVRSIACHYRLASNKGKPQISWIKYDSL